MTGTVDAINSALASLMYSVAGTSWDTINLRVTALATLATPQLFGTLDVKIEYSCSQASAPKLIGARFHSELALLNITFDRGTTMAIGTVPCATIFDTSTTFFLGYGAVCSFQSASNLYASLGLDTQLRPGSDVVFLNRVLRSCATSDKFFSGIVSLGSPFEFSRPTVDIDVPSSVSSCDELILDAASSQGYGGLPVTYFWEMNSSFVNSTNVTGFPSTVDKITFLSSDLVKFSDEVNLLLTITDYLDQNSTTAVVRVPVKSTALPQASISQSSKIYASASNTLAGAIKIPECAKSGAPAWTYTWSCSSHSGINSALIDAGSSLSHSRYWLPCFDKL